MNNVPPTICLVMIVRDESHVIERCLASVAPLISHWCIVDTGSTDDTAAKIERRLSALPGALHHRPWVDFGHNRSEALALARDKADYLLLIDADEQLLIDSTFAVPEAPDVDAWGIRQRHSVTEVEYVLPRLLRGNRNWRFEGVLHEFLSCDTEFTTRELEGLVQVGHFDSARNQSTPEQKYLRDVAVLEKALADEPDNRRYQFYLAQSLRDAGRPMKALKAYQVRAGMGGWDEEVFYSLLSIARLLESMKAPPGKVVMAYLTAWQARPVRAEPLVDLARLFRQQNKYDLALLYAERAATIPLPGDILFVDAGCYRWRALDELAVARFWTGDIASAERLFEQLLAAPDLPERERARVEKNLRLAGQQRYATADTPARGTTHHQSENEV